MRIKPQTIAMVSLSRSVRYQKTPYKLMVKTNVVARLLWWALGKMRALEPYSEKVECWTFQPETATELNERILAAIEGMPIDEVERSTILVGGPDFQEMLMSPTFLDTKRFVTGPFGHHQRHELFGLPIVVVPRLRGVAVVPKSEVANSLDARLN